MDFSKEAVSALATYLRENIDGEAQVLSEWPSANIELQYPAISITTRNSVFSPCDPRLIKQGEVDEDTNKAVNSYNVGQYDLSLQVDIWARNKEERTVFYDKFFQAFNANFRPMGLRLKLSRYYDRWVAYTMTGYEFQDSQRGSETEEWRAVIAVEATGDAVMEQEEFIIQEAVLQMDVTTETIPDE